MNGNSSPASLLETVAAKVTERYGLWMLAKKSQWKSGQRVKIQPGGINVDKHTSVDKNNIPLFGSRFSIMLKAEGEARATTSDALMLGQDVVTSPAPDQLTRSTIVHDRSSRC